MAIDPLPPALVQLYTDDVVADRDDPNRVGVITRTAWEEEEDGDDEPEEDDEDGDEEDAEEEEPDRLPVDHARILWLPPSSAPSPTPDPSTGLPPSLSAVHPASRLTLVDRSLLHGDVVVRASDPLGLMGSVVDVHVNLTVVKVRDRSAVVRDLPSTAVSPVHVFSSGVHVTKNDGKLLGWVDDTVCDVHVKFEADGAECVIRRVKDRDLQDAQWDAVEEEDDGEDVVRKSKLWYPGQQVKSRPAVWRAAEWLKGSKASAQRSGNVGVISRVTPASVEVEWISGVDRVDEYHSQCEPSELTVLGWFEASRIMLGDHVMLPVSEGGGVEEGKEGEDGAEEEGEEDTEAEEVTESSASGASLSNAAKRRLKRQRAARRRHEDDMNRCAQVSRTRTTVSVLWQNGVTETDVLSTLLLPRSDLIDNDFLPHDFVLVRGSKRLATILTVEPSQRTCQVLFLDPIADDVERPEEAQIEEIEEGEEDDSEASSPPPSTLGLRRAGERASVSIFDVIPHPRMELSVTSLVIRMPGGEEGGEDSDAPEVEYGTAGQVVAINEGKLTVKWADPAQTTSVINADQAFVLDAEQGEEAEGEEEDEDDEDGEYDEEDDSNPLLRALVDQLEVVPVEEMTEEELAMGNVWMDMAAAVGRGRRRGQQRATATVEEIRPGEEEEDEDDEEQEEHSEDDDDEDEDGEDDDDEEVAGSEQPTHPDATAPGPPTVMLSMFNRIFGSSSQPTTTSQPQQQPSTSTPPAASSSDDAADDDDEEEEDEDEDEDDSSLDLSSLLSRPPVSASSYSSFFVLLRPTSAHHFLSSHPSPSTSSSFIRKARAEHRLLHDHLPHGIHVLTYESRLDLLRCVIAGPATTPYYSSLFLFDIVLPSSYPSVPPHLFYHSRGYRLSPNLYVEGKCCLSLLNTWSGRTTERWLPDSSTLLQVLLSLQGLVLGETEPFYLEAGYERLRQSTHTAVSSVQYNETALLLTLSLGVSLLTQPDPEWSPLIQSHFAAASTLSTFHDLQAVTEELIRSGGQPLSPERQLVVRSTFHPFAIPVGKLLGQPSNTTTATSSASETGVSSGAPASDLRLGASEAVEEKKAEVDGQLSASSSSSSPPPPPSVSASAAAAAAAAAPPLLYTPSVGFLSALSRDLSRWQLALSKNSAQWTSHKDKATTAATPSDG